MIEKEQRPAAARETLNFACFARDHRSLLFDFAILLGRNPQAVVY